MIEAEARQLVDNCEELHDPALPHMLPHVPGCDEKLRHLGYEPAYPNDLSSGIGARLLRGASENDLELDREADEKEKECPGFWGTPSFWLKAVDFEAAARRLGSDYRAAVNRLIQEAIRH